MYVPTKVVYASATVAAPWLIAALKRAIVVALVLMEAEDAPRGIRRWLIRAFVVLLLFVLATSALPTLHPRQDALREWLDPFVDAVGLWQGQWALFGPEADKINVAVRAVVEFEDGATAEWNSPDWRELSPLQKFRHFRLMEFTDGIRRSSNSGAWSAFADYVVRTSPHPSDPSVPATHISLWRHFVVIPEPEMPLRPIADPFPLVRKYRFYQQDLAP